MRKIKQIFLHCAATPEGKDFTVEDIDNWHKQRGWKCVGYNWVLPLNGIPQKGRDEELIPAHTVGHNANSIGICYIGGMDKQNKKAKDTRTPEQRFGLFKLVSELLDKYNLTENDVYGHYEFTKTKQCPSFDMDIFRKELKEFRSKRK